MVDETSDVRIAFFKNCLFPNLYPSTLLISIALKHTKKIANLTQSQYIFLFFVFTFILSAKSHVRVVCDKSPRNVLAQVIDSF